MRLCRYLSTSVFIVLFTITLVTPLTVYSETTGYTSILKSMGIDVPSNVVPGEVRTYTLTIGDIQLQSSRDGFVNIVVETSSPENLEYITIPGKPMIPFISYHFTVEGYVDKAVVSVKPLSIREVRVDSKILPAPQPLAYMPGYPNKIVYEPDKEFYSRDAFFPGKLADVKVYHGLLGKSIIVVHVYPVQYNPAEDRIIVVDNIVVNIYYPRPKPMEFPEKSLLIITTPALVDLVNTTLGDFYRERGFNVTVVDTEYIDKYYAPVKNITEYPGFYNVVYKDPVYQLLVEHYNHVLARKIIRYLTETYGSYSHVLLIGNAVDVPPSFYFQYSTSLYYYLDPYNAWIPTDLFYADLDRDLVPDLYVGRIPFSDEELVKYVIGKIIAWYNTTVATGNTLFMSGGYPFGFAEMFGETALSTFTLFNLTWTFNTYLLTRTSGNYNADNVKFILQGNAGALWYFILSHGSGNTFSDLIATPEGIFWETLATSSDLLAMDPNPAVPVVSSVACMNGAWDTELVPPWFPVPSIGQAILLSPAGGIAYIGSARVAWELLGPFVYHKGVSYNLFYGATLLHGEVIAAYNSYRLMGKPTTLGEVVATGITWYLADTSDVASSDPMFAELIVSEIMMLSLLGSPALELPVPKTPVEKPWLGYAAALNALTHIDSKVVFMRSVGSIPFFKPLEKALIALGGGGTAKVYVVETRIYSILDYLMFHVPVASAETIISEGRGIYSTIFDETKNGKVLVKFIVPGWGELRFQVVSAGLIVEPEAIRVGGQISIQGYGFDAFGPVDTLDLYVAGRWVTHVPVDPVTGVINWTLAVPYTAPGVYLVQVYSPQIPIEVVNLLSSPITVYSDAPLEITLSAPHVSEVGETLTIPLVVLYKGQPVSANVSARVLDPDDNEVEANVTQVSPGVYTVSFSVNKTGLYKLEITASYVTPFTISYGYKCVGIVVVDRLYDIGKAFNDTMNLIRVVKTALENGVTDIINRITILDNRTVVIDTKLGEIKGMLVEINDNILAVNTTAGVILVKLDDVRDDIRKELGDTREELSSLIEEKSSELSEKIANLTTIVQAMVGLAYVITIATGVLVARRR